MQAVFNRSININCWFELILMKWFLPSENIFYSLKNWNLF